MLALRDGAVDDPFEPLPADPARAALASAWTAETLRLAGRATVETWVAAARGWDRLSRPHEAAYCRWRAAEVALRTGHGECRPHPPAARTARRPRARPAARRDRRHRLTAPPWSGGLTSGTAGCVRRATTGRPVAWRCWVVDDVPERRRLSVLLAPGASGRIPGDDAEAIGADVSSDAAHASPATPARRAQRLRTVWCGWVVVAMSVLLVVPVG